MQSQSLVKFLDADYFTYFKYPESSTEVEFQLFSQCAKINTQFAVNSGKSGY